jgi:hypothetical protein
MKPNALSDFCRVDFLKRKTGHEPSEAPKIMTGYDSLASPLASHRQSKIIIITVSVYALQLHRGDAAFTLL